MNELQELPNIGKILKEELLAVGIDSPQALQKLGGKEAFLRIRRKDPTACFHKLLALEGAARGVRKYDLPEEVKADLKVFFESLSVVIER